jgi:hypothetical protein
MAAFNPYEHGARALQTGNSTFNPLEHGARPIQKQKEYSYGNRAASLGKSAVSGAIGSIPDTASLAYNLPAMGANYLAKKGLPIGKAQEYQGETPDAEQLPLIPSATHAISEGIDNLTDGYTETPEDQKWLNQGVEFAAGVGGAGAVGKGVQALGMGRTATLANVTGTTNKSAIAGAGATGATMSALEDQGAGTSFAGGLAAGMATTGGLIKGKNIIKNRHQIAQNIKDIPSKLKVEAVGLGEKNLNLEAAKNAKELGIDLPNTPFSDTNRARFGDYVGSKISNKLPQKYKNAEEQTKQVLEEIYDATGPQKTEEVQQKINSLYSQRVRELPQEAVIKPNNTIEAVNKISINSIHPSKDEKALLQVVDSFKNELTPTIKSKFGDVTIPAQDTSVQRLADSKRSLNSLIKWDVDEGVKNQARSIQKGLANDIAEYGKTNPEWYKTFKEADDLFGKVAKREKLEQQIGHKAISDDVLSYNKLSKAIHDPKSKAILEKNATPEVMGKLEKLGTVAKAMTTKNKNVPNPSGTAVTGATLAFIGSMFTNPVKTLTKGPALAVISTLGYTKLLTSEKVLDAAIKFAEKPTEKAAVAFNIRMKQLTGYTPVTLAREAAKHAEEEQNEQGTSLRKKFNDHIEENKKRPKGQALIKGLSNPTVQKTIDFLHPNPWKE